MKQKKILFFLVFLTPLFVFSQEIILPNINIPGEASTGVTKGIVLGENLFGPRKIIFSGDQGDFQKEKTGKKISEFGKQAFRKNKLATLYSGRIFSPGIIEPFVFVNKTSEELALIEVRVFPTLLDQPYTLFLDLSARTSSKSIQANQSDDAGMYTAKILINLIKI